MPEPRSGDATRPQNLDEMTDREAAKRIAEALRKKTGKVREIDPEAMKQVLKAGIKGQDHVIDDLVPFLRQNWGKSQRNLPIANLLFVGPPGTGKTELTNLLTESLYEDRKYLLRFDCTELQLPESPSRLIGHPRGYSGWEKGGDLTRPMLGNPRRVILFDEIEKAHSNVFDLFLGMMDPGRLTEQSSNKTADFTEAIIILTSNAEIDEIARLQEQITKPRELTRAVKNHLKIAKVFRPELINRLDQVYVFRPLEADALVDIVILKIAKLVRDYNMQLAWIAPDLVAEVVENSRHEPGAREVEREATILLGDVLIEARARGCKTIRITRDADGILDVD